MSATQYAPSFDADDDPELVLHALGLDTTTLRRAAEAGEAERRTCTPWDPMILGGVIAWGRTVRALREILVPRGWKAADILGLPLVISPDGALGVTVATGDLHTGLRGARPNTRYPKGAAFPVSGGRQLALFEATGGAVEMPDAFWVLLISRTAQELRLELSRPTHRASTGRIAFDADRIVIAPIVFDQGEPVEDVADDEFDVDVDVERL